MEELSIFITAHIQNETQLNVLFECLKKLRENYNEKIFIIDNNSFININYLENQKNNIIIINHNSGSQSELLFYYYYYKLKPSKKAIYIHDSMILLKKIDISNITNIKFLLEFNKSFKIKEQDDLILKLNHGDKIIQTENWVGCFGCSSIITYDYLEYLIKEYNLLLLMDYIKTRIDREMLERIIGIVVCYDLKTSENLNFFGDLWIYQPLNYNPNKGLFKISFGR